jgi:sigma-B regulation protein RsbU (phosphoserine phosphatase)
MKRPASFWFKTAAAIGAVMAVLLVVDTVFAYRYVRARFARDEGYLRAVEEVSSLEHEIRREHIDTIASLERVLRETREDRGDEMAWIRVLTAGNEVEASSGTVEPHVMPAADGTGRSGRVSVVQDSSRGEILIALLPMKQPLQLSAVPDEQRMVEVALFLRTEEGLLHPLGRNLLISTAAAMLLLGSVLILVVRLPAYVKGRALESELQLARVVQQKLLPHSGDGDIEFAGECVPAGEVGGDFYDVFRTDAGETVVVLADVSGKGMQAALRMGVARGAIRAFIAANGGNSRLDQMAGRLNQLLKEGNSAQFVTLFWGIYNPWRHDFRYVNAGHPAPFLASSSGELRRLETGGPVVGLLSKASYEEEYIRLDDDETLIVCSDGLLEATSPEGEDFGDSQLAPLVRASIGMAPRVVLESLLKAATGFIAEGQFQDDLTILVAKLTRTQEKTRPVMVA